MRHSGWRALAVFWIVILLATGFGVAVLQSVGPPAGPDRIAALAPPPVRPARPTAVVPSPAPPGPPQAAPPAVVPAAGRAMPGPIEDPDPALLEVAKTAGGGMLPRIDATGRAPMSVYARGFDSTTLRPRIGLIVAGLGVGDAGSPEMVKALPGGVTLAISPYAARPEPLLEAARIGGHEFLLSLPMESAGDAGNDTGDHALSTSATPAQNVERLDWSLSRFAGYAGVTDALGTLRGERFASDIREMAQVMHTLAARGLFYVEARAVAPLPPGMWAVNIDLLVDEPAVRSEIDTKLATLENLARLRGHALGLVGTPRSLTIDRITDWANGLAAKGLTLAPASALVRLQPGRPAEAVSAIDADMTGATK